MDQVFEKTSIAGLVLENRILRSATFEGMGESGGHPRKDLLTLYERLASNKVGAIITGLMGVQRNGRTGHNMCMFDRDEYINDYKTLNRKVRDYNVPIILQLAHGGGQCFVEEGEETVAPSSVTYPGFPVPRELAESEIEGIIESFVQAIVRARKAKFAGIQLHAAHGYLLSEFLSTRLNKRNDNWGGTLENRFRIIAEIIKRARHDVGDYPILIKISAYESYSDRSKIEEAIQLSQMIQNVGFDAIEVSCGIGDIPTSIRVTKSTSKELAKIFPGYAKIPDKQTIINYNVESASKIKERVAIPVIVVGGIRILKDIEEIIGSKSADYVSMCRPFIIEPDIVAKFISGNQDASRCINCGYCLMGVGINLLKCYYGKIPTQLNV